MKETINNPIPNKPIPSYRNHCKGRCSQPTVFMRVTHCLLFKDGSKKYDRFSCGADLARYLSNRQEVILNTVDYLEKRFKQWLQEDAEENQQPELMAIKLISLDGVKVNKVITLE